AARLQARRRLALAALVAPEPTQPAEPPAHAGGPRLADEAGDKGGEGEPPTGLEPGRAAGSGTEGSHPAKPL
ncbi:hypothetical protein, partial [Teichococcus aestuarii]|uniref:hypothetical protein n=1 Tax=Teichococcus aestuarii TaxID=568898 RepID=UPI003612D141